MIKILVINNILFSWSISLAHKEHLFVKHAQLEFLIFNVYTADRMMT